MKKLLIAKRQDSTLFKSFKFDTLKEQYSTIGAYSADVYVISDEEARQVETVLKENSINYKIENE